VAAQSTDIRASVIAVAVESVVPGLPTSPSTGTGGWPASSTDTGSGVWTGRPV